MEIRVQKWVLIVRPKITANTPKFICPIGPKIWNIIRVSVQAVKSLGGHFASLFKGFDFHEVKKKIIIIFKKKREILLPF
jgi:hypothetical protein